MEKTKLGLSVPVAAGAAFLLFTLCGSTVGFLFLGYILLCETDTGLKRKALTAALVYVGFMLINELIGLIPGAFGLLEDFVSLCKGSLNVYIVQRIANLLYSIVNFARDLLMLVLALKAWKGNDVELGFVKKLLG